MSFKDMKLFLISSGLFFVVTTVFISTAIAGGNQKEGKKIFDGICSSCHGDGGITETPGIPVFASGERINKTDEQLKYSIRNGVNNPKNPAGMTMPPYGGGTSLNDNQLADVIAYVRTLKKK